MRLRKFKILKQTVGAGAGCIVVAIIATQPGISALLYNMFVGGTYNLIVSTLN
jgi:hypothetical protein